MNIDIFASGSKIWKGIAESSSGILRGNFPSPCNLPPQFIILSAVSIGVMWGWGVLVQGMKEYIINYLFSNL